MGQGFYLELPQRCCVGLMCCLSHFGQTFVQHFKNNNSYDYCRNDLRSITSSLNAILVCLDVTNNLRIIRSH